MIFHSDAYHWLGIAGAKASYKGRGTINGIGNYGFLLSGIDGDLKDDNDFESHLFRIKFWDMDYEDIIIYDTQVVCSDGAEDADPCPEIGGGSIVVHKGKEMR